MGSNSFSIVTAKERRNVEEKDRVRD